MTLEDFKRHLAENEYNECESIDAPRESVYEIAEEVHEILKRKIGGEFDIIKTVKLLGGKINIADLSEWANLDGTILIHGEKDFDVFLPEQTSPVRDKFTLAHELGHYFLHTGDWGKKLKAARMDKGTPVEVEANWFAAGLLMPTSKVEDALNENKDLSVYFQVSREAARYRKNTYSIYKI